MWQELVNQYDAHHLWEQARRAATMQEVLCSLKRCSPDLMSFEAAAHGQTQVQKIHRGVREIPIDQIQGSVGRSRDFTNLFLPRSPSLRWRWQRIVQMVACYCDPVVELYKLDGSYYVMDGHHRVSAMRALGRTTIAADVWEIV